MLHDLTHTGLIHLIHRSADTSTNQDAQDGSADDCNRLAGALADVRSKDAPDCAAHQFATDPVAKRVPQLRVGIKTESERFKVVSVYGADGGQFGFRSIARSGNQWRDCQRCGGDRVDLGSRF